MTGTLSNISLVLGQQVNSPISLFSRSKAWLLLMLLLIINVGPACRSSEVQDSEKPEGLIIVNAPVAGEVRRILVSTGTRVSKDAPIVEIIVQPQSQGAPPTKSDDPQAQARATFQSTEAEVDAARAEVVRTESEVQRLTPLIPSGAATQPQLDAARADYDKAQQRLQRALANRQGAQSSLLTARQSGKPTIAATPREQIVAARASSAGIVRDLNTRIGEHVTAGQPLATIRAEAP